jgi:CxxC motif-containing protein
MGCHMTLEKDSLEASGIKVMHNQCPRGKAYAIEEMTAPTRMLTSTVVVEGGILKRLPVKTSKPIPKGLLQEVMSILDEVTVKAPVTVGTVLVEDLLGTGASIVATRSMVAE